MQADARTPVATETHSKRNFSASAALDPETGFPRGSGAPKKSAKEAMRAGARAYAAPPFPKQHQPKPGSEANLHPLPLYDAPFYLREAERLVI